LVAPASVMTCASLWRAKDCDSTISSVILKGDEDAS
jgi:hypothetical protein